MEMARSATALDAGSSMSFNDIARGGSRWAPFSCPARPSQTLAGGTLCPT